MVTKFRKTGIITAFLLSTLVGGNACKGDEGVCGSNDCSEGTQLYSCKPTTGFKMYACEESENFANQWCQGIAGKPAVYIACEGYGDEIDDSEDDGASDTGGAAAAWDPSSNITYDVTSGRYLVNESFVEALRSDPGLILLDATRVEESPTGYYALENVTTGDLAAAMGLQSGDVVVSVNGYDLGSVDGLVDAFYAVETATTFKITILRTGNSLGLTYLVQ